MKKHIYIRYFLIGSVLNAFWAWVDLCRPERFGEAESYRVVALQFDIVRLYAELKDKEESGSERNRVRIRSTQRQNREEASSSTSAVCSFATTLLPLLNVEYVLSLGKRSADLSGRIFATVKGHLKRLALRIDVRRASSSGGPLWPRKKWMNCINCRYPFHEDYEWRPEA